MATEGPTAALLSAGRWAAGGPANRGALGTDGVVLVAPEGPGDQGNRVAQVIGRDKAPPPVLRLEATPTFTTVPIARAPKFNPPLNPASGLQACPREEADGPAQTMSIQIRPATCTGRTKAEDGNPPVEGGIGPRRRAVALTIQAGPTFSGRAKFATLLIPPLRTEGADIRGGDPGAGGRSRARAGRSPG